MSLEGNINSQEILNAIDLGKINFNDKKKRGRPKKTQQLINPIINKTKINTSTFDQDEIILHLPISASDIQSFQNKIVVENAQDNCSDTNSISSNYNKKNNKQEQLNELNNSQYNNIIKKLKEENDKLKKYLIDVTPMYFTEVKTYPVNLKLFDVDGSNYVMKYTNIPCWWCTYNFDWLPVGIPEKYHNDTFYVWGCFCSFNCKAAYNLNINDNRVWERYTLMKQLYYIINKDNIVSIAEIEINPAGPKELLEKYGGPMSIDVYRKNSKILGKEYHKLIPPFTPINMAFQETNVPNKTNSKTMNIHNLLNPNLKDSVVIKRNKPLKNIASKEIDAFME